LNERLVFGMAPDHIADVMTQRLRWAMGALQILMRDNPLRLVSAWAMSRWGRCAWTAGAKAEAGRERGQAGAHTASCK
jgi:cellulose synthase/poly-beta-1,6-N-acetylglucosamine synthase-like glycosyltransferase